MTPISIAVSEHKLGHFKVRVNAKDKSFINTHTKGLIPWRIHCNILIWMLNAHVKFIHARVIHFKDGMWV